MASTQPTHFQIIVNKIEEQNDIGTLNIQEAYTDELQSNEEHDFSDAGRMDSQIGMNVQTFDLR